MSKYNFRAWMDGPRIDEATGKLTEEYEAGITSFMQFAANQSLAKETRKMYCPCTKCQNMKYISISSVWSHLHQRGMFRTYRIWYSHGEIGPNIDFGSHSGSSNANIGEELGNQVEEETVAVEGTDAVQNLGGTVQMVNEAYREEVPVFNEARNRGEEPNLEARHFFSMLDAAKKPLWSGCEDEISPLSTAAKLMNIKTDYNLSERCMDAITSHHKKCFPRENTYPTSYNEIQKLVAGLGLPYEMIDVCVDNCMIFWRHDSDKRRCRFCRKPRYQETTGRTRVPFKRMWYLPLADRLKRLYQSERTAGK